MVEVPLIPTTTVLAVGGTAIYFRKPIINAGTMVRDAALDNPLPTLIAGAVAVPVIYKLGGFTTTDKWNTEAPYTPQPTANQSNALVARTAARVSNVADKAIVKANTERMIEIDAELISGVSESKYIMLMQEKGRLRDENIRLEAKIIENERAIRTHNSTIHPWRDNISDWYVKNGPLTTENRAMASSVLFFGAGAYLVYNLVGDKKVFAYKGRTKRRPATAFGFTA
tara:strand:+ start:448 stop:1128 length:681 start_codon:yes stop_codon:yes gene_type:complete